MALFNRADEVVLRVVLVVTFVTDSDDGTLHHEARVVSALDDLSGLEHCLKLADTGLHLALRILGGVVIAVLLQVAKGPCGLNGVSDLNPASSRHVFELGLQTVVGGLGEFCGGIAHISNFLGIRRKAFFEAIASPGSAHQGWGWP